MRVLWITVYRLYRIADELVVGVEATLDGPLDQLGVRGVVRGEVCSSRYRSSMHEPLNACPTRLFVKRCPAARVTPRKSCPRWSSRESG